MKIYDAKPSFAGGELAPTLHARVDLAQYAIGARKIENFIVLPQGGLINRPGTKVLSKDKTYSEVRLVPFVFSEDDSLCLAFGNRFVDIYDSNGFKLQVTGSPYREAHLPNLRWLQSGDVLYLFHQDVPVHTLSRHSDTDWRFEKVEFKYGPFLDMNTDEQLQIRIYGSYDASAGEFFYGGFMYFVEKPGASPEYYSYFTTEDVGRQLKVEQRIKPNSGEIIPILEWTNLVSATGSTGEYFGNFFGPYTWRTSGKWGGTITIQRCDKEGWEGRNPDDPESWDWRDFKTYSSENTDSGHENFSWSGSIDDYASRFRIKIEGRQGGPRFTWNYEGGMILRYFEIISVYKSSGEDFTRATLRPTDGTPGNIDLTDAWAVSAFGKKTGYPKLGIFHQERLVLASTPTDSQTLWMSQSASWHKFKESIPTEDDDAIITTLVSKQVNDILGLASRGDLLILTNGGEWGAKAGAKADVFTPSSMVITPSGYRGSHNLPPLDVGASSMFVQQHGTTVRSLGYSLDVDGYASSDISLLAAHMFENNPVVAWAYQQTPWSVVWCVLGDGTIATLTHQQEHQVMAWTRQRLSPDDKEHKVLDVCCIPGDSQDDVFFAVQRDAGVQVERLRHRRDWLDEEKRETLIDPTIYKDAGVYGVSSVLECLEWEQQAGGGTLQGRHKQVPVLTLRLHRTCALRAGVLTENNGELDDIRFPGREAPGPQNTPYSGDVRLEVPGGFGRSCRLRVENSEPAPVTLLGVFPEVNINEE